MLGFIAFRPTYAGLGVMHNMNMKNTLIIIMVALLVSGLSFYGGLYVAGTLKNESIDTLRKIYATQGVENEIAKINIHLFYMEEINKENYPELVKKSRQFINMSLNLVKDLSSMDILERPMISARLKSAQKFVDEE